MVKQFGILHFEVQNVSALLNETGLQKLGARSRACIYCAPKTLIRYTKKRAPKINSNVYCINHRKKQLRLLELKSIYEKRLSYIPNKHYVLYAY